MRRIITLAALTLTMAVGGAAMASPRYETRGQERRQEVRREERHEQVRREERHFDRDRRPEVRYERFEHRSGYRFEAGEWRWNGYEWIWMPGHYVRAYR